MIAFVLLGQLPFYLIHYSSNNIPLDINVIDLTRAIKKDKFAFLSAFSTLLYSYGCHYGVFAVYNAIHDNTEKRMYKVIQRSILIDALFYSVLGLSGYFTQPNHTPTFILDREKIGETDYLMTICRIFICFVLICKLPVKYNSFRNSCLNLIFKTTEVTKWKNIIITSVFTLSIACVSALFTDIGIIIDFLGGFCSTTIAYCLPILIFFKTNKYKWNSYINICAALYFGIMILCGYSTAVVSLYKLFTGDLTGGSH